MVPTADQFRILRCQVSFYTPGMVQFHANKILTWLFAHYITIFDGDPITIPVPTPAPKEIAELPRVVLKSIDGKKAISCGTARLDVTFETDCISDVDFIAFLDLCNKIGIAYLEKFQLKAGRIACLVNRAVNDENPAASLAKHFCKEEWIRGPLNRPGDFELHAHKRFPLGDVVTINSWMRCSCAFLLDKHEKPTQDSVILVRQDFNSLNEDILDRAFTNEELSAFLSAVPEEMSKVLNLYFPPQKPKAL